MEDRGSVRAVQLVSVPVNQAEIPFVDMPLERVESLSDEPQSQNPIMIEETMPEKGSRCLNWKKKFRSSLPQHQQAEVLLL